MVLKSIWKKKIFIEKKINKVALSLRDIKEYSIVYSSQNVIKNVIFVQELTGSSNRTYRQATNI